AISTRKITKPARTWTSNPNSRNIRVEPTAAVRPAFATSMVANRSDPRWQRGFGAYTRWRRVPGVRAALRTPVRVARSVDTEEAPESMYVYAFDHKHRKPPMTYKGLLGGKGANLAEMTTVLELPVPPGFTVSTDACRDYMHGGWPDGLDAEIAKHVTKLEKTMGRKLGDPN